MSPRDEDLAADDRTLLRILEAAGADATRRAGAWLACRPGCAECCMGPFPVTRLDEWRLRRGLEALERKDPDRAAAVLERAASDAEDQSDLFPGDPSSGDLAADERSRDAFFERFAASPCPALDPETLCCDLYAARPVSCRTYGPPVRIGGEDLEPCALCFVGAPRETVLSCRVEPDPDGVEDAVLDRFTGEDRETTVAFALVRGRSRVRGG